MKVLKYSRQRESIKACLMSRNDHPTADMLYMSMREQYPNISLGTVYRNLNLLVELGEIQKVTCGDGVDRFDYDISPHYHFICQKCNAVMDLPLPPMNEINEAASACLGCRIDNHAIYFRGTCPECMKQQSN